MGCKAMVEEKGSILPQWAGQVAGVPPGGCPGVPPGAHPARTSPSPKIRSTGTIKQ